MKARPCTTALSSSATASLWRRDAIVVIVSEETGIISMAKNGVLIRRLDRQNLFNLLQEEIVPPAEDEEADISPLQKLLRKGGALNHGKPE